MSLITIVLFLLFLSLLFSTAASASYFRGERHTEDSCTHTCNKLGVLHLICLTSTVTITDISADYWVSEMAAY